MISSNCDRGDHSNCNQMQNKGDNSNTKCQCVCHVTNISPESMQEEKDKLGITKADELRAEAML